VLSGMSGVGFRTPPCKRFAHAIYKEFFLLPLYGQALKFERVTDKSGGSAKQRHKTNA
jgi:hypothetical protein